MKRPDTKEKGTGVNDPFPDADWVKRFPILCQFLADVYYDDGELREPSLLSFKAQDGLVLASLTDKDLERGLYRTGKTCLDAVGALEKSLASGNADWRPWRQDRGGKSKRA